MFTIHYLDQGNTAQKKQRTEQFTFELGSPAKSASPVAQSASVAQSTPVAHSTPKLPSASPNLCDTSFPSPVSRMSDDVVQPHPSPTTNIVINLDNYSNNKSADQGNSSNKVNCVHNSVVQVCFVLDTFK